MNLWARASFITAIDFLLIWGAMEVFESPGLGVVVGLVATGIFWTMLGSPSRKLLRCPVCHGILPDRTVTKCMHCGSNVAPPLSAERPSCVESPKKAEPPVVPVATAEPPPKAKPRYGESQAEDWLGKLR
jgi:hypothetical protein